MWDATYGYLAFASIERSVAVCGRVVSAAAAERLCLCNASEVLFSFKH
jgi:hypothetical protein